jgi:Mrp family chromosome partitioning ATPase
MYRNEKVNVPILGLIENMAWFTPAELPETDTISSAERDANGLPRK